MKEFVLRLKQKPEHVRRRIAVATSVGATALVALIWAGTMASGGAFALGTGTGNNAAAGGASSQGNEPFALSGTNVESNFSQLLGAVSAATGASSSDPTLTIIDGDSSSSFDDATTTNPSATVIPF